MVFPRRELAELMGHGLSDDQTIHRASDLKKDNHSE
jgi:hypothetical protein